MPKTDASRPSQPPIGMPRAPSSDAAAAGSSAAEDEGVHPLVVVLHEALDVLRERLGGVGRGDQFDDAALGGPGHGAQHTPLLVECGAIGVEAEPATVGLLGKGCVRGGDHHLRDPREARRTARRPLRPADRTVGIDPDEHTVGGTGVDVPPSRPLHEGHHAHAPRRQRLRLNVGIGGFEHEGVGTLAAPVEAALQGLAQGLVGVGRRHELDVAATVGGAHGDVGAQVGDGAVRGVEDGHAEALAERSHGEVEVVHHDGDPWHGGDHWRASIPAVLCLVR